MRYIPFTKNDSCCGCLGQRTTWEGTAVYWEDDPYGVCGAVVSLVPRSMDSMPIQPKRLCSSLYTHDSVKAHPGRPSLSLLPTLLGSLYRTLQRKRGHAK